MVLEDKGVCRATRAEAEDACQDEGVVTDGCVVCPWHGAQFDLATGQALTPPAVEDVRTYQVVVSGDDVCLQID